MSFLDLSRLTAVNLSFASRRWCYSSSFSHAHRPWLVFHMRLSIRACSCCHTQEHAQGASGRVEGSVNLTLRRCQECLLAFLSSWWAGFLNTTRGTASFLKCPLIFLFASFSVSYLPQSRRSHLTTLSAAGEKFFFPAMSCTAVEARHTVIILPFPSVGEVATG